VRPLLGVLAALVTGGGLFLASNSFADQVLVDVGVALKSTFTPRRQPRPLLPDLG